MDTLHQRRQAYRDLEAAGPLPAKPSIPRPQRLRPLPPFARIAVNAVREGPRGTVLQLPVGDGSLTDFFSQELDFITAVDTEQSAVDFARGFLTQQGRWNCTFLLAKDLRELPVPPEQYAGVVSSGYFGYLPQPKGALREMLRVLRPGGHAVLEFPAPGDATRQMSQVESIIDGRRPQRPRECGGFYSDRMSLEGTLAAAGVPEPWRIERKEWDEQAAADGGFVRRESWIVTARNGLAR